MWVVKIGGSLNGDPLLPQWLELFTQLGGGRVTLVCGGGQFAEAVRRCQALWRFDDLAAHNMATLAMVQSAYMMRALNPALQMASSDAEIRHVLHRGLAAVWSPSQLLREAVDADTNWDVSADSMALGLALRLHAERMVVVKSCAVDASASWQELGAAGVLDRRFERLAQKAAFPIDLVRRDDLERVRSWLLADCAPVPNWSDTPRR
jgi:5-(aminomethyl)-3-furanmethanol phosphate kinase